MSRRYDVIIVGAGMVGATLAVALSRQPQLKIALIEAGLPDQLNNDDPYDLRVSALTRSSEYLLKNLGIWQHLLPERISAFTDMKVWETEQSQLHFASADLGEPWLGHLLENRHLQQASLQACKQHPNIDLITPAKPVAYQPNQLQLDNGMDLEADLIVAADGALSPLREWAGIEIKGWPYHSKALVCVVKTEQMHQFTAWQRFLNEGPLAFLPLPDPHLSSIVWSLNSDNADRLLALPEQDFIAELNEAFEFKLGHASLVSDRAVFPLQLRHAEQYIQPGLALVGDAAHTIHPLAGQGVNIGLLDAATLAEVVLEAAEKGRHIGNLHTLQKYQRRRRADNYVMQLSMDAFKRVFGSNLPPVRWARRFGLDLVNRSVLLRNLFMQQGSARDFAVPELSKRSRLG